MRDSEDCNALFERLLERSGGFGRFQKLFLALCIYTGVVVSFNHFSAIYFTFSPNFVCSSRYPLNGTAQEHENLQPASIGSMCSTECDQTSFDKSTMHRSLVTTHMLVCEREVLLPFITGSYMLGVVTFSLMSGFLSDKYGRKPTVTVLAILHLISSLLAVITFDNFWLLILSRFVVGGSSHNVWAVLFIISMETTLASKRTMVSGLINTGWNLGGMMLAFLALMLRDAWHMQIVFAVLALFIVILLPLVPESPRWLMQHQKDQEALRVYKKMADFNGINAISVDHVFDALLEHDESKEKTQFQSNQEDNSSTLTTRFSRLLSYTTYPEVRRRLLLLLPPFLACGTCSYGIHFTTKFVPGNLFLTAMLKEAFTLTWIIVLISIYRRMRRTNCLLLMFNLSGLSAILFFFLSTDIAASVPLLIKMLVFGATQALITGNYYLVDTYVPEVFSTDTRNLFFSLLETSSKVGTVLAPFVVDWGGSVHHGLPAFIFGCIMLGAALVFLFCPETKGQPLKQRVDELTFTKDSIIHRLQENAV